MTEKVKQPARPVREVYRGAVPVHPADRARQTGLDYPYTETPVTIAPPAGTPRVSRRGRSPFGE